MRNLLPATEEIYQRYSNPDGDKRGEWQSISLNAQAGHATPSQFYEIITPSEENYPLHRDDVSKLQRNGLMNWLLITGYGLVKMVVMLQD